MAEEAVLEKEPAAEATQDQQDEGLEFDAGDVGGIQYNINKTGQNKFDFVNCSTVKDLAFGRYTIETSKPIPELNSQMATAYSVTDKQTKDSNRYYAMVLGKSYPFRLEEANKLLGQEINNFTNIVAVQILPLSIGKGRFFTVVMERPKGQTLEEYIAKNGAMDEDVIVRKIIAPINNILEFFAKKNITHGRINSKSVYITDDLEVTLSECISEPCGYSQNLVYENVNRASVHKIAKGVGRSSIVDYHALGVLAAIALRGSDPLDTTPEEEIIEIKFVETTYKKITEGLDISLYLSDFLRGTINDKNRDLWGPELTSEWLKGRRFNLLPPTENVDSGRPIIFNNKKFSSKKHLSYAMHLEWDDAKRFILDDTLLRWIERSVQDNILTEKMEILANRTTGGDPKSGFDRIDELLAQYIMVMDPGGPMRLRDFSANIDGLGVLLAHSYETDDQFYLEHYRQIISHSLVSYVEYEPMPENETSSAKETGFVLQRCTELFRKKYFGFGLERCLYELNPTLPCLSPIIKDYVCLVSSDLLISLDSNKELGTNIVDIQMAAFLSMRLEIPVRIRVKSLTRFPDYATEPAVQNLSLLSLAQQRLKVDKLPHLTKQVVEGLDEVVQTFHSRSVREDLTNELNKFVNKGSLPKVLEIIANTDFLVRDKLGFRRAVVAYRNNTIQIIKLSNRKAINNMGYRYGLQLSVLLSFFLATIVVLVLVLKVV